MTRHSMWIAAALLGFAAATPFATAGENTGTTYPNPNSAAPYAPGQQDQKATECAPGQRKAEGESAKQYAPGQAKKTDDDDANLTTGSVQDDCIPPKS